MGDTALWTPITPPKGQRGGKKGVGGGTALWTHTAPPKGHRKGKKGEWGVLGGGSGGFKRVLREGRGLEGPQMRGGGVGGPLKRAKGGLEDRKHQWAVSRLPFIVQWEFPGTPKRQWAVSRLPFIVQQAVSRLPFAVQ